MQDQPTPSPYPPTPAGAVPPPASPPAPLPPSGLDKLRIGILAGVLAAGLVLGAALFVWQYQVAGPLKTRAATLAGQVSRLRAQYASLQNAGTVSTADWTRFDDTSNGYSFKYPKDWTVDSTADPRRSYVATTITNPAATIVARYGAPYYQTSGNATFRPVKIEDYRLGGTRLKLVGGYYISSVYYTPFYVVVDEDDVQGLVTTGATSLWDNDMRFHNGNDTVKFNVGSAKTTLTSREQAEVWFASTDGKTAYALIKSLFIGTKTAPAAASTTEQAVGSAVPPQAQNSQAGR